MCLKVWIVSDVLNQILLMSGKMAHVIQPGVIQGLIRWPPLLSHDL